MRGLAIAIVALLLPLTALADNAQPPMPTLAETAPMPRAPAADLSFHNVAAISIGAIAGVVVVNMVTGGMIMPVLAAGAAATPAAVPAVAGAAAPAAIAGVDYIATASQIAVAAVGAVVGGYVGNWLYGR